MSRPIHLNNAVQWYMEDLTSRIVAKTGIPGDRFHLGKIILESMKETDPEAIMQIDGGTGQSENYGSVLKRTIQCANGFRNLGIEKGDVVVLMAPNHLDLAIPFYAAFYLGAIVAPVDQYLGVDELQSTYSTYKPRIIFCQNERLTYVKEALQNIGSDATVITFDKGEGVICFSDFLKEFENQSTVEDFTPTDFDTDETIAFLIPTSGTTGLPKGASTTHKSFSITLPYIWARYTQFPSPTRLALIVAPLQWLSASFPYIASTFLKYPRLQSSLPITQEHAYHLINKYRPSFVIMSPTMMATLLRPSHGEQCDFSCFDAIWLGGSAVHEDLMEEVKILIPGADIVNVHGMSEVAGLTLQDTNPPMGSSGKRLAILTYKLVEIGTGKEIEEPHVPGELYMKGPGVFKGYFNNLEATKEVFDDGWLKSGDMFYRDENWNYFFVERIKLLLKYKNHQISPVEVEGVIRKHPSVLDVAVTSVPDRECGDLPVACVVPRPGHTITAQEIKDLVKDSLTDTKQLRGGVVFLNELPATASTKLHRRKLKELVLTMDRE